MPGKQDARIWRSPGLLALVLAVGLAGWIGWRQAPITRNPLQVRFVRHGTNQWMRRVLGFSNVVFELHNSGIWPLYVIGKGRFSDWPLGEALATKQYWLMDRAWFATNRSPVVPPGGTITLDVLAHAREVPSPGSGYAVTTFIDTKRIWRFRIRSRGMGPIDLIPSSLGTRLPPGLIPNPSYEESVIDVELPQDRGN